MYAGRPGKLADTSSETCASVAPVRIVSLESDECDVAREESSNLILTIIPVLEK